MLRVKGEVFLGFFSKGKRKDVFKEVGRKLGDFKEEY